MYEYDQAIIKIQNYIDTYLPEIDTVHPRYVFDIRSYARWAANEIIERLMREDSLLPPHISGKESMSVLEVIDEFIDDITCYARNIDAEANPRIERMYTVSYNTAQYIKHLFA